LANELLMIEAKGDYDGAKNLIATSGVLPKIGNEMIARLSGIPRDIRPIYASVK
jgi:hypothetical protein